MDGVMMRGPHSWAVAVRRYDGTIAVQHRELVSFLNTRRGIGKVMYGSDFPVLEWADSLEQIRKLELKPDAQVQLLEGSARAVFRL